MPTTDWLPIAVGLLLIVLVATLGYYALQRLRARRTQLLDDLSSSPVFAEDRAHNQIQIGRGQLAALARDGIDVPRAGELLNAADAALQRHENVQAVQLALNAHDLLVSARRAPSAAAARAPLATGTPRGRDASPPAASIGPASPETSTIGGRAPAALGTEMPDTPSAPPKNRMEAHFQMTLLVEQLNAPAGAGPRPAGWAEAEELRSGAQAAYARGDYTEALRLALRGRRRIGAQLETLPPVRAGTPASGEDGGSPARAAVPSETPCARCGRPLRPGDRFCRSCGAALGPAKCPRCQATIETEDTFCSRCGSPLA